MKKNLVVTKNTLVSGLAIIAMLALLLSTNLIGQVSGQSSSYVVGFEEEQVVLQSNTQVKLPIVVSGATDRNAVSVRVEATGSIRILDITAAPELLSVGKEVDSTFAKLDIAKQSSFEEEEYVATLTVANNGESGEIRFLDSTSVNGAQPRTLGVSISSSLLTAASPTSPVNVASSVTPTQFTPRQNTSAMAVALAITITLLIFCILGILALTKEKEAF